MTESIEISQQLLQKVKTNSQFSDLVKKLENIDTQVLYKQLNNDNKKTAFLLNIYNAFNIILLKNNPTVLLNRISRKQHFTAKKINISGKKLSLDDIEHGMIRNSKIWWSKGYLKKLIVSEFEKKLSISQLDPRIHFALNCGAESCPAIRFYCHNNIDKQLDVATKAFLSVESEYNPNSNTLTISKLLYWYSGDFGGKKGIISFISSYGIIESNCNPLLKYKPYNWKPLVAVFG